MYIMISCSTDFIIIRVVQLNSFLRLLSLQSLLLFCFHSDKYADFQFCKIMVALMWHFDVTDCTLVKLDLVVQVGNEMT